jgi:citrate lyase subunit gamma (acyl carrier protein)
MITLTPQAPGSGISIEIDSNVLPQYGEAIHAVIADTLAAENLSDIQVRAVDRGALDYTIAARLLTAIERAHTNERSA